MNTQSYKGFVITSAINGNGPAASEIFYVEDTKGAFNPTGYSTLSGAKGAITKYLKAQGEADDALLAELAAPTKEEKETASAIAAVESLAVKLAVPTSRNKAQGKYAGKINGRAARFGKRFLPEAARKVIPVPSWNAAAFQNNKRYDAAKKVGA